MEVNLIEITPRAEQLIEQAARVSHDSGSMMTDNSAPKMIKKLIQMGHESVLEHASATFIIKGISRACSHQLVRHRLASYTQRSQRYVSEDGFDYVTPPSFMYSKVEAIDDFNAALDESTNAAQTYSIFMEYARRVYKKLQESGIPREDARFILPNACTTTVVMTANFREWRHIFKLRGAPQAQWEIRKVVIEAFKQLSKHAPSVFYDMELNDDGENAIIEQLSIIGVR